MKAVLIAAMALAAMSTGVQAQQNYPPYPDVWGRELPVSGRGDPTVKTAIYPAADGDMLAYESFLVGEWKTATTGVRRVAFFSGHDVPVPLVELEEQERKWPGPIPRSRGVELVFPDGYEIDAGNFHKSLIGEWKRCLSVPVYYAGKNFRYDARKTLIRLFPSEMVAKGDGAYCNPKSQPTTFKTKVRFAFLTSNQDYILPDGTFLTVLDDDFIVRFDRTLHSAFIDQRPDLFLVDFAQVEPIFAEATHREKDEPGFNPLQFIHDRLTELVAAEVKPIPQ